MTNVWRVVSTAWWSHRTYCGSWMWCNSWLSTVLYWRRVGGRCDVTSRRCDVSDSVSTWNVSVDDWVVCHLTYEWSLTDTRQIQSHSATYSWRSWRQTTMSRGTFIPVTLMTTSSGLSVSVLYRRIVEDTTQTTYMMLSRYVTPVTLWPTTYSMYIAHKECWKFYICGREDSNSLFLQYLYRNKMAGYIWLYVVMHCRAALLNTSCIASLRSTNLSILLL